MISGVFHIGLDDDFDASKLESVRSGNNYPRVHVSFPLGTIRRMHTQVKHNEAWVGLRQRARTIRAIAKLSNGFQ